MTLRLEVEVSVGGKKEEENPADPAKWIVKLRCEQGGSANGGEEQQENPLPWACHTASQPEKTTETTMPSQQQENPLPWSQHPASRPEERSNHHCPVSRHSTVHRLAIIHNSVISGCHQ